VEVTEEDGASLRVRCAGALRSVDITTEEFPALRPTFKPNTWR